MDWFYAKDGQQVGPVSDAALDDLVRSGAVRSETLVWREGMANWQPCSVARSSPGGAGLPPVIAQTSCVMCNRAFSRDDLLLYDNVLVCAECKPGFFQRLREGIVPGGIMAWRSGNLLVIRKEAELPDRCVKCNVPANGRRLRRKLHWHSPYLYLLIPVGLLVYALVATIVGKRARIQVGICETHHALRKRDILLSWLFFVLAIVLWVAAGYFSSGWTAAAGFVMLFISIIYAIVRTQLVSPKRIDDHFVWLKGVAPAYIADLPEFPGR